MLWLPLVRMVYFSENKIQQLFMSFRRRLLNRMSQVPSHIHLLVTSVTVICLGNIISCWLKRWIEHFPIARHVTRLRRIPNGFFWTIHLCRERCRIELSYNYDRLESNDLEPRSMFEWSRVNSMDHKGVTQTPQQVLNRGAFVVKVPMTREEAPKIISCRSLWDDSQHIIYLPSTCDICLFISPLEKWEDDFARLMTIYLWHAAIWDIFPAHWVAMLFYKTLFSWHHFEMVFVRICLWLYKTWVDAQIWGSKFGGLQEKGKGNTKEVCDERVFVLAPAFGALATLTRGVGYITSWVVVKESVINWQYTHKKWTKRLKALWNISNQDT